MTRNYDYYYISGSTYIYSYLPLEILDIMLTEDDILEKIDRKIENVDKKINELKGEEEKDEVEFNLGSQNNNKEDNQKAENSKKKTIATTDKKEEVESDQNKILIS